MLAGLTVGLVWFALLVASSLFLLGFVLWAKKLGVSPNQLREYRQALGFKLPSLGGLLQGLQKTK